MPTVRGASPRADTSGGTVHRLISGAAVAALLLTGIALSVSAPTAAHAATSEAASADPFFEVTPTPLVSNTAVGHSEAHTARVVAHRQMTLFGVNLVNSSDSENTRTFSGVCPASRWDRVTLQPGEFCELTWTTHPTRMQTSSSMLSFTAQEVSDSGEPVGEPEVSGFQLDLTSTVLTFDGVLRFPDTPIGESATETIRLTNSATIDALVAVTVAPGAFSPASSGGEAELRVPAGGHLDIPIQFIPAEDGTVTEWGDLAYRLDNGSSERRSSFLRFTGTGTEAEAPAPIVASASSVDFGTVSVGKTGTGAITLANNGTEEIAFVLPDTESLAAAGITVGELPGYGFVTPGDSIELPVTWSPSAAGTLAEALDIEVSRVAPAFAATATPDPGLTTLTTLTSSLTGRAVVVVPPIDGGEVKPPTPSVTTPQPAGPHTPGTPQGTLATSGSGSMIAVASAAVLTLAAGAGALLLGRRRARQA